MPRSWTSWWTPPSRTRGFSGRAEGRVKQVRAPGGGRRHEDRLPTGSKAHPEELLQEWLENIKIPPECPARSLMMPTMMCSTPTRTSATRRRKHMGVSLVHFRFYESICPDCQGDRKSPTPTPSRTSSPIYIYKVPPASRPRAWRSWSRSSTELVVSSL